MTQNFTLNLFVDFLLAGPSGFYILENLQPTTTYDLRFASKNLVGFSEWGAGKQLTMPQRGPPEKPRINTMVSSDKTQHHLCSAKALSKNSVNSQLILLVSSLLEGIPL